ncbi:MAG TPA: HAMP domain-containing sensor histidine kinase [Archangium sp.]|uniref:HAMP domain-containing sensor histidine kinase n=1 Tax=Archangium sp. TaxID=1872627 RepID=UPI002E31752B|nr:HAMP domain-containing sensor histidine kinase [Archangium sp.]HEX5749689.1 HAMP domain-containing sensor histidine kinase [Archangium sp.]
MSLRRRFILVLGLAVIALGAAALAVLQLRAQSATERAKAAFAQADTVVEALSGQLEANPSLELAASAPAEQARLRSFVASLLAPLVDASAGYCASDGTLLLTETVAPPISEPDPRLANGPHAHVFNRPHRLLPLDQHAVEEACRAQRAGHLEHGRFTAPKDVLFISVLGTARPVAAWALVRLPNRAREGTGAGWAVHVGLIGVLTLALVGLTAEALWLLRRGAAQLLQAQERLAQNLHTEVPRPRAEEFARLAEGLRTMAHRLIAAQERERLLERRLGQEQRLVSLGRVIAGVAHEVRNPLTGMKLLLDTMLRRRLDERSKGDIATCLQEIERLDQVVGSLLLVARKVAPTKALVDLGALADERLRAAESLARERRVRLVRQGSALCMANREQMIRVLDNLVRNAIEASPREAEVRIHLERSEQQVRLIVVDRGEGVPLQREGELFEPFFTLKPEGTGLGLFLSRSLVEAHGGSLAYHREPGETRFVVTLPMEGSDA